MLRLALHDLFWESVAGVSTSHPELVILQQVQDEINLSLKDMLRQAQHENEFSLETKKPALCWLLIESKL